MILILFNDSLSSGEASSTDGKVSRETRACEYLEAYIYFLGSFTALSVSGLYIFKWVDDK
jgi:hypothetical protein